MRPIDADALLETVEDRCTALSCCLTVDEWRGKTDMKQQIIEDIRNAPTVSMSTDIYVPNNGWISVKEKMPKIADTVQFTGLSSFGTRFIPQRGWFDGTFWKRDTGETVYSNTPVTHWMPLPSTEGLDET